MFAAKLQIKYENRSFYKKYFATNTKFVNEDLFGNKIKFPQLNDKHTW